MINLHFKLSTKSRRFFLSFTLSFTLIVFSSIRFLCHLQSAKADLEEVSFVSINNFNDSILSFQASYYFVRDTKPFSLHWCHIFFWEWIHMFVFCALVIYFGTKEGPAMSSRLPSHFHRCDVAYTLSFL